MCWIKSSIFHTAADLKTGTDIDAVLDRLPTAQILAEEDGIYTVSAEVFGKGIDMWLKSQGTMVTIMP